MSRLNELEEEIEQTDIQLVKLLITRVRLGQERRELMDGIFPDSRDAQRIANMKSSLVGSMLATGGLANTITQNYMEQLYYGLTLDELNYVNTLQTTASSPAWIDIALGRMEKGGKC